MKGFFVDYTVVPDDALARVIHEANRAYNVYLDDMVPDAPWDTLPLWHRDMITDRIRRIRAGESPEDIHWAWVEVMFTQGWSLGGVKDPYLRTHPCLRPWGELPLWQRRKDELAVAITGVFLSGGEAVLAERNEKGEE